MPLHSELLFNALCDSGCADWLDYHFQKKIMSYFPLRRTQYGTVVLCLMWQWLGQLP